MSQFISNLRDRLESITSWLKRHRSFTALTVVFAATFLFFNFSFAQDISQTVTDVFTTLVQWVVAGTQTLLLLLIDALIAVIQYDAFSDNVVIDTGWPLMRDAMNMFVVLALLAIAGMNLIPNRGDSGTAQKQIASLFFAVVLMNFSRTITLLAVDFSQVVMLTFVDAVKNIASGNFITMFGLDKMLQVASSAESGPVGLEAGADFLGALVIIGIMLVISMISIATMLVAFLARIMMLWILIVLSPLAFFAMGLKGVFGQAGQATQQWTKQFAGMLLFGPILAFFLWLSMTLASQGNLAAASNFPDTSSNVSIGAEFVNSSGIMNSIVAVVLLMVGVFAAAQAAGSSALGSILNKGKDVATSVVKKGAYAAGAATAIGATGGAAAGAVGFGAGVAGATALGAFGVSDAGVKTARFGTQKVTQAAGATERAFGFVPGVGAATRGIQNLSSRTSKKLDSVLEGREVTAKKKLESLDEVGQRERLKTADTTPWDGIVNFFDDGSTTGVSGFINRGIRKVTGGTEALTTFPSVTKVRQAARAEFLTNAKERGRVAKDDKDLYKSVAANALSLSEDDLGQLFSGIEDKDKKDKAVEEARKAQLQMMGLADPSNEKASKEITELLKDIQKSPDKIKDLRKDSLNKDIVDRISKMEFQKTRFNQSTGQTEVYTVTGDKMIQEKAREDVKKEFADISTGRKGVSKAITDNGGYAEIEPQKLSDLINNGEIDAGDVAWGQLGKAITPAIAGGIVAGLDKAAIQKMSGDAFQKLGNSLTQRTVSELSPDEIRSMKPDAQKQIAQYAATQVATAAPADKPKMVELAFNDGNGNLSQSLELQANGSISAEGRTVLNARLDVEPKVISNMDVEPGEISGIVVNKYNDNSSGFKQKLREAVNKAINGSDAQKKSAQRMMASVEAAIQNEMQQVRSGGAAASGMGLADLRSLNLKVQRDKSGL